MYLRVIPNCGIICYMENKSKLNTVLLVIIIILLVIGLFYIISNNSKQEKEEFFDKLTNKLSLTTPEQQPIPLTPKTTPIEQDEPKISSGYISYSGNAPFTFSYPPKLFKPDLYNTNSGSKTLSIESTPESENEGCDMVSISTLEMNKIPVCYDEFNRYTSGVMNYCKKVVGSTSGTTYKVNASTSQVCGKPTSQTARNFVDHLVFELANQ